MLDIHTYHGKMGTKKKKTNRKEVKISQTLSHKAKLLFDSKKHRQWDTKDATGSGLETHARD